MSIENFLQSKIFAVIGVSADQSKYGTKVYRDLKAKGYQVYGVNPKLSELDGDTIYPNLKSLPEKPEVISIVTPPAVTEQIVLEAAQLGIDKIWMQPGAESETAIESCHQNNIEVVHSQCVMIMAH